MTDLSFTEDDKLLVAHVMGMNIFVRPPLMKQSAALRDTYAEWLGVTGKEAFAFFSTESMSKHRKVSKKTLEMLPSWLVSDMPRDFVNIDLVSSDAFDSEGETRIYIHSMETEYDAEVHDVDDFQSAILRLTLPLEKLPAADFRELFIATLSRFKFVSAAAGHALVTSQYYSDDAQTYAWKTSMHHPGADIYVRMIDSFTTGLNGLKTVNWLTAINDEMLDGLGGRSQVSLALPGEVELITIDGGVVLQAGPEPLLGSVNQGDVLPLYQAVDAVLKPLRDLRAAEAKSFSVNGDDGTATGRWFARFEPRE